MNDLLKFAEEIHNQCQNGASISDVVDALGKYILADRAQGQEPVGYIGDGYFSTKEHLLREGWREDEIEAVYTRAQPTPAQIAEMQLKILNRMLSEWDKFVETEPFIDRVEKLAEKLRKGEPL